jgi:hypothetical protein
MGATHIRLAAASEDMLAGALRAAWKIRVEKNARTKTTRQRTHRPAARRPAAARAGRRRH